MARNDTKAENEHYVPQFLLKNFGQGKKHKVCWFDKLEGKTFPPTNPKNLAVERDFYSFKVEGFKISIESSLSDLEAKAKHLIERLIREETVSSFNDEEKLWLATFVASQHLRTKHTRELFKDIADTVNQVSIRRGGDPEQYKVTDEDAKVSAVRMLTVQLHTFVEALTKKHFLLFRTTHAHPFYISDHPVVMHNDNDFGKIYGNLGWNVKGIQIFMPIGKLHSLAFFSPSIFDEMVTEPLAKYNATKQRFEAFKSILPPFAHQQMAQYEKVLERIQNLEKAFRGEEPAICTPDNVTMMNSLQVKFSHRQVYSSDGDFSLAIRMLEDVPAYKHGPQMKRVF